MGLPKPGNKGAGGFHIPSVVVPTGFEFAGFDKGDSGQFEEEEEEDGWNEPEVDSVCGVPSDEEVATPKKPFKEVVGMSGVFPKSCVADVFAGPASLAFEG